MTAIESDQNRPIIQTVCSPIGNSSRASRSRPRDNSRGPGPLLVGSGVSQDDHSKPANISDYISRISMYTTNLVGYQIARHFGDPTTCFTDACRETSSI